MLHTPVLVSLSGQAVRPQLPLYCAEVRKIAAESGALLVDHETHWRRHFGEADPIPWLDDPAHPNAVGHLQLANHALRPLGLGELTEL